jgi:hypothetical protein
VELGSGWADAPLAFLCFVYRCDVWKDWFIHSEPVVKQSLEKLRLLGKHPVIWDEVMQQVDVLSDSHMQCKGNSPEHLSSRACTS